MPAPESGDVPDVLVEDFGEDPEGTDTSFRNILGEEGEYKPK
tara:strand:+ start:336 stop:461 length:126 start_codon:yes stop_codon:yes gene_type:complete